MIQVIETNKSASGGQVSVSIEGIMGTRLNPTTISGYTDKDCDVQILDHDNNIVYQMPAEAYDPFSYQVDFTGGIDRGLTAKVTDSVAKAYINLSAKRGS